MNTQAPRSNKKNSKKIYNAKDRLTIPITYPNTRDDKTNIAKPSLSNVEQAKEWVEFDQL